MDEKVKIVLVTTIFIEVILFLFITGFLTSFIGIVSGYHTLCNISPYDPNCICAESYKKISVPSVIPKWNCEYENLFLDPNSSTFQQDAIEFVKNYLTKYCGDICSDLSCGGGELCYISTDSGSGWERNKEYPNPDDPFCIEALISYTDDGKRNVHVRCEKATKFEVIGSCNTDSEKNWCFNNWGVCHLGTCYRERESVSPWQMEFYIENPTSIPLVSNLLIWKNYCYNEITKKLCTSEMYCEKVINPDNCYPNLPLDLI